MRALRAVRAILRTSASLNRKQPAELHAVRVVKLAMKRLRGKQQIGQRLPVNLANLLARPVMSNDGIGCCRVCLILRQALPPELPQPGRFTGSEACSPSAEDLEECILAQIEGVERTEIRILSRENSDECPPVLTASPLRRGSACSSVNSGTATASASRPCPSCGRTSPTSGSHTEAAHTSWCTSCHRPSVRTCNSTSAIACW